MASYLEFEMELAKPVGAAAAAYAIDMYYFKSPQQKALMSAGAVGLGIYAGSLLGNVAPVVLPDLGQMASGKQVERRILETGVGVAGAYALNRFVLKGDMPSRDGIYQRIGAIFLCDVAGEFLQDFLSGRPLSFLV